MNFSKKIFFILIALLGYSDQTFAQAANNLDLNTLINQLINKSKNKELSLSDIPGFSNFAPYVPSSVYNFLKDLKLTNLKAQPYKSTDELISAETNIEGIEAQIRIILGANPSSQASNTSSPNHTTNTSSTYIGYIENIISETEAYVTKIAKDIVSQLSAIKLGLVIELPKGFQFAQLNPDLKFLDSVRLEDGALALGTNFNDPTYGDIKAGLTLIAKAQLEEPFLTANNFIKNATNGAYGLPQTEFELRGNILPGVSGTSIGRTVPGRITFQSSNKPLIEFDNMNFKLIVLPPTKELKYGSGLSLGLSGGLKLLLNNMYSNLSPLDFEAFFNIDTSLKASLSATMSGLLDLKPVGLPFTFGNVTINQDFNIQNMQNLNLKNLVLAGQANFGPANQQSKLISTIDLNFNENNTNIFTYGTLEPATPGRNALSLSDILNLSTTAYTQLKSGESQFKANIPELAIKHAEFFFSPSNIIYGNKTLPGGLTIDTSLDIFGGTANVVFKLDQTGFDATGYIVSEIDLGLVKILGASESKTCQSADLCNIACNGQPTIKTQNILFPNELKNTITNNFTLDSNHIPQLLQNRPDYSKATGGLVNIFFHPPTDVAMLINAKISADAGPDLGVINSDACINATSSGIFAYFQQKVLGVLDTQFSLHAKDYQTPNKQWYICGKATPATENLLVSLIAKRIDQAKQQALSKINDAQNKVSNAQAAYNKALNNAQSKVSDAQAAYNKALNAAKAKISQAADSIQRDLDKAKKACGS
ncbi:hypothetical protein [Candidatus Babela massiliensis]|uniref:Uncharacterized protein n=1 Tax=Candidatus Babela massiliensis TaxID=673862 RepID=V6DFA0_9BACT|nr:hypothetical protein [Candidatus Babela massiliensis]CDK30229.1 hypothetical protein BABL1_gene_923 [Candidatus Babela massiliensis]